MPMANAAPPGNDEVGTTVFRRYALGIAGVCTLFAAYVFARPLLFEVRGYDR